MLGAKSEPLLVTLAAGHCISDRRQSHFRRRSFSPLVSLSSIKIDRLYRRSRCRP
jgi:hypothetical protein